MKVSEYDCDALKQSSLHNAMEYMQMASKIELALKIPMEKRACLQ